MEDLDKSKPVRLPAVIDDNLAQIRMESDFIAKIRGFFDYYFELDVNKGQ